jgi:hypothetical protein
LRGQCALARFQILNRCSRYQIVLFNESADRHVVHRGSAQIENRLSEVHRQSRVIKLPIVVFHAPLQTRRFQRRNSPESFLTRENLRRIEAKLARKAIVNLHSDPVERPFPPAIDRNDKREMMNQMRRVFTKQSALTERFEHKGNISLLQITDAAMH